MFGLYYYPVSSSKYSWETVSTVEKLSLLSSLLFKWKFKTINKSVP